MTNTHPSDATNRSHQFRNGFELISISFVILFLELACIRWFPAHVLYLTFFTNVVLLASFLGMSVGCLAAGNKRNYLRWTPLLLVIALIGAHAIEVSSNSLIRFVDVGNQASPQQVYFGTEYHSKDLSAFAIPVEVLCGFFFTVIALAFIGPGQELGRALKRWPNRVQSYTLNIIGSIAGIVVFAACSWLELSSLWWFLIVAVAIAYFLFLSTNAASLNRVLSWNSANALLLLLIVWLAGFNPALAGRDEQHKSQQSWSPYYRIEFTKSDLSLSVNLIYHQQMVSRNETFPAYALPHILNRDAGRSAFKDVLIIGAGSGNDVSRALQWGAAHVDAVEIDPAINRIGRQYHPDKPYDDRRVQVHLDDGRNFLRSSTKKYDLVVYALVDSLVLHSGYSNIRLESFLFTRQAFEDVKRHLKPNGNFVIYNYFRQGWLAARLQKSLEEVFGAGNPVVLTMPYREVIDPSQASFGDFTVFFAGDTEALRSAFSQTPEYRLPTNEAPTPNSSNGFHAPGMFAGIPDSQISTTSDWLRFGQTKILPVEDGSLRTATDDWPFLYLRKPMLPTLSVRGMVIMGALAFVLIYLFLPRREFNFNERSLYVQVFFLGAGFMLVETKAVVTMALIFGSTWIVNSVVFFAVLVMILLANYWTLRFQPARMWPYYAGLFVTLLANTVVPLDLFLGLNRTIQVTGACLLVFAPILFAAVIFASVFKRTQQPDHAIGVNIAGAMFGGLAEYSSMLLGFQYLVLVAIVFYGLSAVGLRKGPATENPAM